MLDIFTPYEITITVHPKKCIVPNHPYGRLRPTEQWRLLVDFIKGVLDRYQYKIMPELHKNGNIHVHGIAFLPEDITKLEIVDIRKNLNCNLGRSNFKPISDYKAWRSYIHKEQKDVGYLSKQTVLYNHYDECRLDSLA